MKDKVIRLGKSKRVSKSPWERRIRKPSRNSTLGSKMIPKGFWCSGKPIQVRNKGYTLASKNNIKAQQNTS